MVKPGQNSVNREVIVTNEDDQSSTSADETHGETPVECVDSQHDYGASNENEITSLVTYIPYIMFTSVSPW